MKLQKKLRLGMLSLMGLELGLALAYIMAIWSNRSSPQWLDWNGMRSLPSVLQALHLFAIGTLALSLLRFRQRMQRPISWVLPLTLGLLCFYGGFDELTKVHLLLDQFDWKFIYLAILTAIPIMGWRDLTWLWCTHRPLVLWILAGISIFLLGGFGAGSITDILHEIFPADTAIAFVGQQNSLQFLAEHLRIIVEEFAELLGETLILFGIARLWLDLVQPHRHSGRIPRDRRV